MATNLDEFNVLAQKLILNKVYTNIFPRNTLMAILGGSAQAEGKLDRPNGMQLLGSARSGLSEAERSMLAGTPSVDIPLQTVVQGGSTKPGYHGVSPSVIRTETITESMRFFWTDFSTPVMIWKQDLDLSRGLMGLIDIGTHNIDSAMNDHGDMINTSLIAGNPVSQTVKIWSDLIGLVPGLDSGATYATYGGVDKNVVTMLKPGLFSSTAVNFSWSLIDAVNRDVTKTGDPIDLVVVNNKLFFDKIMPKALAEGLTLVHVGGDLPEFGALGIKFPAVRYGAAVIVPDRSIPAGADSTSASHMVCLNTKELVIEVDPRQDFTWSGLKDLSDQPGGDNAFYGRIESRMRFYNKRPWNHGLYTNVN